MKEKNPLTGVISRRSFIQLIAVAGTTAACWKMGLLGSNSLQVAQKSKPMMGTVINLKIYGPDRDECEEILDHTLDNMIQLERKLSRHMKDSELGILNSTGALAKPSTEIIQVLTQAEQLSRQSQGSFDVTILPLLRLFEQSGNSENRLTTDDYTLAHNLIGYQKINISPTAITLHQKGMEISLDGIGKGYIVDQGVETLKQAGYNNIYVEAGGDLMVSGQKNGKEPWLIGIRNPRPSMKKKPIILPVTNKAVATSGDYFNNYSPDFKRHHIIDPRSGFSPPELASVTVTAPNVMLADGLATAVMAMGRKEGLDFIESQKGCEAYLVGKDLQEINSSGFFS